MDLDKGTPQVETLNLPTVRKLRIDWIVADTGGILGCLAETSGEYLIPSNQMRYSRCLPRFIAWCYCACFDRWLLAAATHRYAHTQLL